MNGPGLRWNETTERRFREWYARIAEQQGLDPDPDNPLHYYDYRKAFLAGVEPGPDGHWPSEFKEPMHPNRLVGNMDTRTGRPLMHELMMFHAQRGRR